MDIRKEFLEYFQDKNHEIIDSMSIVPDDPTLMFTNAGMVQFKDIFTGTIPIPKNPKATSCQLCLRAGGKHNDLENVGYTARHHTLFEMLGNFSFGDYFKKEAISYAWDFITNILKFPKDKLWVTVHEDDKDSYDIWSKIVNKNKIVKLGDKDNFWAMGDTGACGPCSEIFYDQGAKHFNSSEDKIGGDGDRFLEIWNLVFMQFDKQTDGTLKPLPKPSIDTGMGLERVVAIKEGVMNNFDSSLFQPIIKKIIDISNIKQNKHNIASLRVMADHTRAVCFMLSDGILFDKEGRGYVLRRILRRAIRHGYLLGFKTAFISKIVDTVISSFNGHYKFVEEKKDFIKEQITLEENRFFQTIDKGMSLFNKEIEKLLIIKNQEKIFSGEIAFKLYDTFGFPLDLTQDMLKEYNITLDIESFNQEMDIQRKKAKASWKGSGDKFVKGDFKNLLENIKTNEFVGYNNTSITSKVVAMLDEDFKQINTLSKNNTGWLMLDKTVFYATSGGQEGDTGIISNDNFKADAIETSNIFNFNLTKIVITSGNVKINDNVHSKVNFRNESQINHSATHLLQSALKNVLGNNILQAGSLNNKNKLRFDFTYQKALTFEQLSEVEQMVNKLILKSLNCTTQELPIEEAKKKGAISMFGEKYSKIVRVVSFGDDSIEFCGGTHVQNTSQIGSFYITKECAVGSGVRRIEAVCGNKAFLFAKSFINKTKKLEQELKTNDLQKSIIKMKENIQSLKNTIHASELKTNTQLKEYQMNDVKVIIDILKHGDLKTIADENKNKYNKIAVCLFKKNNNNVQIVCVTKGINFIASNWIKDIAKVVDGSGGGRSDFAQAGGSNTSKINDAEEKALQLAKEFILS